MQTSRSVSIPTTRWSVSTTGTQPMSLSHIFCAAVFSVLWVAQLFTSVAIKSFTFMVGLPFSVWGSWSRGQFLFLFHLGFVRFGHFPPLGSRARAARVRFVHV